MSDWKDLGGLISVEVNKGWSIGVAKDASDRVGYVGKLFRKEMSAADSMTRYKHGVSDRKN